MIWFPHIEELEASDWWVNGWLCTHMSVCMSNTIWV